MDTRVEVHISSSLSDEEWKILQVFCEKARRLTQVKLVMGRESNISGRIRIEAGSGLVFHAALPPEEQVAEFLLAFRFFYLQRERTSFLRVLSLLGKHSEQNDARQALRLLKRQWNQALFNDVLQISACNQMITASVLMDLWFNAHYFHADEEKGIKLERLASVLSEEFSKYMLLDAVYEATKLVFKVYESVRDIVENKFRNL
jgi:hypothetical protein